ncbi:ribosomal-protein-alanine acetyltransferase [Kineobactrum sediminis]|uniref:Ribosomal-protein-alanine acetyltransferase n=1 Tax=Kineobactrum sediminis TaxID=1905677 RepID=A0A2N5Y2Q1_9GAMM|nr:GNAT family N-acetyltransferase/peptidase C39 family protein [Kineobactrum sediminis]PLW82681.1 ribosomal-protein-alanine acetyltransferase [Kineobactrum sediminis]
MNPGKNALSFSLRPACESDLDALDHLETASFASDRLSRRRLKHWIQAPNSILIVAETSDGILGYGLVLLHRGTRLARLYSIAVSDLARGYGLGRALMKELETGAAARGRLFMRLEVAQDNSTAIRLYESLGYLAFGTYHAYYEDQRDALRMQKQIRYAPENLKSKRIPWYRQTTEFTCGPAAAMMAMAALDPGFKPNQEQELDIWREATTIFMTSGHGGSHPVGLALAASRRGFNTEVVINRKGPLFVESVRNPEKKQVITAVHEHFLNRASDAHIRVRYRDLTQKAIEQWLSEGAMVLVLISTYRMDYKKSPHWVVISAVDDQCLYLHDPDPTEGEQSGLDCQYLPIARTDFDKMSLFGRERLRTAVVIRKASPA